MTKMPKLQSLTKLFWRVVSYLGKFILNLPEVIIPLKAISKEDTAFNLQNPQLNDIEKMKTLIMSAPILQMFDSNLPLRLKIDPSFQRLRALLEQNLGFSENTKWRLIGYSFPALHGYEKQYAQSEKETL